MKNFKKRLISVFFISFLLIMSASVFAASYIGNKNTGKLHIQGCTWEERMNPSNKVPFKTRENALNKLIIPTDWNLMNF